MTPKPIRPVLYHLVRVGDRRQAHCYRDRGPNSQAVSLRSANPAATSLGYEYGVPSVATWCLAADLLWDALDSRPAPSVVAAFAEQYLCGLAQSESHVISRDEIRLWAKAQRGV